MFLIVTDDFLQLILQEYLLVFLGSFIFLFVAALSRAEFSYPVFSYLVASAMPPTLSLPPKIHRLVLTACKSKKTINFPFHAFCSVVALIALDL